LFFAQGRSLPLGKKSGRRTTGLFWEGEFKLFIGQFQCSLEEDNRVGLPAVFGDLLAGRVVITQGFERNILVLPADKFQDLSRLVASLNIADPLARGLQRMLLGNASYALVDDAGSISLPDALSEFARLASRVVLVGQGNYFEVWSQTLWEQQELVLQDAEANSQRYASVNLAGV
jgi:MraZ protein